MNENLKKEKEQVKEDFFEAISDVKKDLSILKSKIKNDDNIEETIEFFDSFMNDFNELCKELFTDLKKFDKLYKTSEVIMKRLRKRLLIKYLKDVEKRTFVDIGKYMHLTAKSVGDHYHIMTDKLSKKLPEEVIKRYNRIRDEVIKDYQEGKYIPEMRKTKKTICDGNSPFAKEHLIRYACIYYHKVVQAMTNEKVLKVTDITKKELEIFKRIANYNNLYRNAKFWEAYQTYLTKNNIKV